MPDEVIAFLAVRAGGDARTALNALELAVTTAQRGAGAAGDAGRRRGRAAAQGRALRQGRRPALRLHLGLDQVDARVGPGRLALLPRGDGRGRRGPALHRPPHDHPGLRGHRQRRPAGARRSRSRRRTRSSTSGCRRRSSRSPRRRSTCRWRRSRTPSSARSARSTATSASAAPSRRRPRCSRPPTRRRASSGAGKGYDYPHEHPGHVNDQEHLPEGARGAALLLPRRRRAGRRASGWPRSARPAAASDVAHTGAPRGCRWRT